MTAAEREHGAGEEASSRPASGERRAAQAVGGQLRPERSSTTSIRPSAAHLDELRCRSRTRQRARIRRTRVPPPGGISTASVPQRTTRIGEPGEPLGVASRRGRPGRPSPIIRRRRLAARDPAIATTCSVRRASMTTTSAAGSRAASRGRARDDRDRNGARAARPSAPVQSRSVSAAGWSRRASSATETLALSSASRSSGAGGGLLRAVLPAREVQRTTARRRRWALVHRHDPAAPTAPSGGDRLVLDGANVA